MNITIPAKRCISKGGTALSAIDIGLTAFGLDDNMAKRQLEAGVRAWCNALQRTGSLKQALECRGYTNLDGDLNKLEIVVQVTE